MRIQYQILTIKLNEEILFDNFAQHKNKEIIFG